MLLRQEQYTWQGPLPPPAELERYEALCPGFTARTMDQWDAQSAHRQSIEKAVVLGSIQSERRGQSFGLIAAIACLVLAGFLAAIDQVGAGLAVAIADVAGLAGIFVYGRHAQDNERARKRGAV